MELQKLCHPNERYRQEQRSEGEPEHVRRTFLLLSFVAVVAGLGLSSTAAATSTATGAVSPKPAASSTPSKKDPCAAAKSKWAHTQCMQFNSSAPGDEYFGRLKISYLGIDNTYKDGVISAGAYSTDPNLIAKLDFATEALQRWAAKYPGDPQLPRSYFLGVQVLRKIYTQPEQQRAWEFIQILEHKYGHTYFGKVMKASVAHGFTEHWFANAELCPTALPTGVMPENAPVATPSPSPAPGQPSIDVITPPCVEPSVAPEEPMTAPSPTPTK